MKVQGEEKAKAKAEARVGGTTPNNRREEDVEEATINIRKNKTTKREAITTGMMNNDGKKCWMPYIRNSKILAETLMM